MMSSRRSAVIAVLAVLAVFAVPAVVRADPPNRAARLGYSRGTISYRPASLDDWAPVNNNYPFTTGDHLWADDDARGEIRVGRSTVVRLGPRTALSFLNLDDDTAQMRISEGSLAVTVGRLDEDEVVEVDTPNAAVSILRPGFYRVDVNEEGDEAVVTVRRGEAEVTAGGAAVPVHSRDAIVVRGDDDDPRYDVRDADRSDEWEDWALERDRREERLESRRYVSDEMVGYEDLDDHGRWREDPEYGHVWSPIHVSVDWAPYRYGRWAWVPPWGWTWIDDSSWGFAPFHYGRWARRSWGWCWVPGTIVARPVYAPALVAFVGGGDNWFLSLSIRGGGVAWFPLGPREVYVPPYRVSPGYIRNVNVTHVTNITQINVTNINVNNINYVNRNVTGAVTAVNRETFVGGRAVHRQAVVVRPKDVQRVAVQPAVVESLKPRRESVVGEPGDRVAVRRPPVRVVDREVVARKTPPPPPPRLGEEGRGAPAPRPLVRPAVPEGGRRVKLRPVREGLPEAREVRPGDRPRARGPEDARPGQKPGDDDKGRERATERERNDRERSVDRPRPDRDTAKPPADVRPDERDRTDRPQPDRDKAKPPADDRPDEKVDRRERTRDKERNEPDRSVDRPRPDRDKAKPPADDRPDERVDRRERTRDKERNEPDRSVDRPRPDRDTAKPPADVRPNDRREEREPARERDRSVDRPKEERPKARPPAEERPRDRSVDQNKERTPRAEPTPRPQPRSEPDREKPKPKPKPTPTPTPTPKPKKN
jgi:Family of unknown function (DUF6600)/FecR protein